MSGTGASWLGDAGLEKTSESVKWRRQRAGGAKLGSNKLRSEWRGCNGGNGSHGLAAAASKENGKAIEATSLSNGSSIESIAGLKN
jgi:hypothetical protein